MRFFGVSLCALVLTLCAFARPVAAQMALSPGHHDLEGVVVMSDSGLVLLTEAGSFSESMWPLVGQTAEVEAQLKKLIVPQREMPDTYADVPRAKLSGQLAIINNRYQFTVETIGSDAPSASLAARVAALEELAAGVRSLADAGMTDEARKIANIVVPAGMGLLASAQNTPVSSRIVRLLHSLEGFAIGQTPVPGPAF